MRLLVFILAFGFSLHVAAKPSIQKDILVFTSIQETFDWFELQKKNFPSGDRRGLFLKVYHEVTNEMVTMFEQNKFQNPQWVRKLMFEYLSLYRNALECDQSRLCDVSPAWQKAFRENRRNRYKPSVQLLLSISAHVNRDLAIALAHIEADFKNRSQYEDFQRISLIFKRRMPQLIQILQEYQSCEVSNLEKKEITAMMNWVMERTRAKAWSAGKSLLSAKTTQSETRIVQDIEYLTAKQNNVIQFWGPFPSRLICH